MQSLGTTREARKIDCAETNKEREPKISNNDLKLDQYSPKSLTLERKKVCAIILRRSKA